jgi:hypothetical protein
VLTGMVSTLRSVAPAARWTNLQAAVEQAALYRRAPDGSIRVRVYAAQGSIHNDSSRPQQFVVERWASPAHGVARIEVDGGRCGFDASPEGWVRFTCSIEAGGHRTFRVVHTDDLPTSDALAGFRRGAQVFARRRLSEFRDMHLSRNDGLLSAARTLRRAFLGRL